MPVMQCPKCDLRFSHESELNDHLQRDHEDPETEEPDVPSGRI